MMTVSKSQSSQPFVLPTMDESVKLRDSNQQQVLQHDVPHDLSSTHVPVPSSTLTFKQQQAHAELQALLLHSTSVNQISQVPNQAHGHQHHDHHPSDPFQEATAKLSHPATHGLQRRQHEVLAELQAMLTHVPRESSSSTILSSPLASSQPVASPLNPQLLISTGSSPATDFPHHPLHKEPPRVEQHLQRAPSDPSNHDDSDADFDEFLREHDIS